MFKKFITYILIGIGIGSPIAALSLWNYTGQNLNVGGREVVFHFVIWLIASALYGIVSMIMCTEKLLFIAKFITHFVLCFSITLGSCLYLNYFSISDIREVFSMFISFIIIYAVVYTSIHFFDRSNIKKVQDKIDIINKNS